MIGCDLCPVNTTLNEMSLPCRYLRLSSDRGESLSHPTPSQPTLFMRAQSSFIRAGRQWRLIPIESLISLPRSFGQTNGTVYSKANVRRSTSATGIRTDYSTRIPRAVTCPFPTDVGRDYAGNIPVTITWTSWHSFASTPTGSATKRTSNPRNSGRVSPRYEYVIAQAQYRNRTRGENERRKECDWLVFFGDTSSENWRDDNYERSFAVVKPDRWARKSLSAKECVTTHLSNGRMLCHVLRILMRHPITLFFIV